MRTTLPFLVPGTWEEWKDWLGDRGPDILGILVGLIIVRVLFHRLFGRVLREAAARAARARREDPVALRKRADTLLSTLDWLFTIFLVFLGTALLLDQFDVQVSALIAGVGVAGIAVGLGTQTLIRDVINGVFILIEGQYAVGDFVTVGGASGEVIEINPRRTVLRDAEGNIHSIPNSAITVAINRTPGLNRVSVDVLVELRDGEDAARLAGEVCAELAAQLAAAIAIAPKLMFQKAAGDNDVLLQIAGEAQPGRLWEVESELRLRLKRRFDAEGMELRFGGGEAERAK